MKSFLFFSITILFTALHSNLIEFLVGTKHYPSSVILMYRGIIGLVLCTAFAKMKKENAFPTQWNVQGYRLVNAGIIMLAVFESYKHLGATTISLMQRLDIPLIVLLSIFYKEKRPVFQNGISLITIIFTCTFVYFEVITEEHHHSFTTSDWDGFLLITFAAILLAINSRLIKKSVATDNAFVITNITCISTTVMGFITTLVTGKSFYINSNDYVWLVLLTLLLILSYYFLVELYKIHSPEKVQFTGVIAIIATMGFEMLFENRIFPIKEILAVFTITILTYLVATNGKKLRVVLASSRANKWFGNEVEL